MKFIKNVFLFTLVIATFASCSKQGIEEIPTLELIGQEEVVLESGIASGVPLSLEEIRGNDSSRSCCGAISMSYLSTNQFNVKFSTNSSSQNLYVYIYRYGSQVHFWKFSNNSPGCNKGFNIAPGIPKSSGYSFSASVHDSSTPGCGTSVSLDW